MKKGKLSTVSTNQDGIRTRHRFDVYRPMTRDLLAASRDHNSQVEKSLTYLSAGNVLGFCFRSGFGADEA